MKLATLLLGASLSLLAACQGQLAQALTEVEMHNRLLARGRAGVTLDFDEADRIRDELASQGVWVNGRPHTVGAGRISYEEIVALAGAREGSFPTVVFSRGPDSRREGSLTAGQSTEIAAGMLFDAVVTTRA